VKVRIRPAEWHIVARAVGAEARTGCMAGMKLRGTMIATISKDDSILRKRPPSRPKSAASTSQPLTTLPPPDTWS
jgi:hypothetical protein